MILDALIVGVLVAIMGTGWMYRNLQDEETQIVRQLRSMIGTQDSRLAADAIERYRLPEGREIVGVLNDRLTAVGLSDAVMDIAPGSVTEPAADGTHGYPIHVRLTPVPGSRIAELVNTIEFREPRLMIVSMQMTRIRSGDDAVDVTLELMGFR